MIEQFEGSSVTVHTVNGIQSISTKDIAVALGVKRTSISSAFNRNKEEFVEGEDFFMTQIASRKNRAFTKTGIVKLSFFVKSPKAKAFRQWASKVLSKIMDGTYSVVETESGQKVDVLAELLAELAHENHIEAARRIREQFGEELPEAPSVEDFKAAIQKEGYEFGKKWLLTLRTLPPARKKILIAPGVGPTKPRRRSKA